MDRDELLDLLERSVRDRLITEQEAVALLQSFDRGELAAGELPLPLAQAITGVNHDEAQLAFSGLLAIVLNGSTARVTSPFDDVKKTILREHIQDRFIEDVRRAASLVERKGNGLRLWQEKMSQLVRDHTLQQSAAGRGQALLPSQVQSLDAEVRKQQAYLSRFADEISVSRLQDKPLSQEAIIARAELYGGAGRAEWFRSAESEASENSVVDFISQDDGSTCHLCLGAEIEGPYLPGDGPLPGDVCQGRGRCRCKRITRYAPGEARELRRRAA